MRISKEGRHLTHTDGTPFFWLGDTWWFCPADMCPIDSSSWRGTESMFKHMIDVRSQQGYNIAQMAFAGPKPIRQNLELWDNRELNFWRKVDRHIEYANRMGILPVIGFGFHKSLDRPSLDDLKSLWHYLVARYGAYGITWLIAGEYNLDNNQSRIMKVLELGRFIKRMDPYRRAMTVHPWYFAREGKQAWDEPWNDFIMVQGGHGRPMSVQDYLRVRSSGKPFLEAEARYEGIHDFNDANVRLVAYRAMQSGSLGYTYGSHGLWHPIHSHSERKEDVDKWGKPLPWWEALERPGGRQMNHLRKFYETVEWWRFRPRTNATIVFGKVHSPDVLVMSDDIGRHIVYFPPGAANDVKLLLKDGDAAAQYSARWFNPRTGGMEVMPQAIERDHRFVFLPKPPDQEDWLLLLELT